MNLSIKNRRKFLSFILIGLTALSLMFFSKKISIQSFSSLSGQQTGSPEPWMTVFVHGSFGSLLGFLSFFDVMQDKISGTDYQKLSKKIRNDSYFYKDQAILGRGLIPVEPTFDLNAVNKKKYAVYPIAKAYQLMTEAITPGKETNYFYTFGWSGLMSQKSRRFEAIRLYNALTEELDKFKAKGITPKVRLLCHSHGGNLTLNLAAISKILAAGSLDTSKISGLQSDENESLCKMAELLRGLTTREIAKTRINQKVFDYVPVSKKLVIDELIMFGTPIQPETECFCSSSIFKHVFNFYSDEDFVQRADWVSSKKVLSGQRFTLTACNSKNGLSTPKIIQARIIMDAVKNNQNTVAQLETESSALKKVQNLFVRNSNDPTHKELWCMSWRGNKDDSFLSPFPVMVLTPLLIHALNRAGKLQDVDINVHAVKDNVQIAVGAYNKRNVTYRQSINRTYMTLLQEKVKSWQPEDFSATTEFNAIYKYIS